MQVVESGRMEIFVNEATDSDEDRKDMESPSLSAPETGL